MKFTITRDKLDVLKEAAIQDPKGISNYVLIQNVGKQGHFVFRVVCERLQPSTLHNDHNDKRDVS